MIRSDEYKRVDKQIQGVQVFLCTLSMLSHPKINTFTKVSPLHVLVVDEASQIGTKDYLSVLNRFSSSLKRIVFIGDDKQCMSSLFPFFEFYLFVASASIWWRW
jgi:superfamily I DNA and/or RNA helicase